MRTIIPTKDNAAFSGRSSTSHLLRRWFSILFIFFFFSCSNGDISGSFQPLGEDKKPLEGTTVIISPAGEGFLIEQMIHNKVVSEAFTSADEKGRYSFKTSIGITELEIVLWKKGKNKIKGYSLIPVSEKKTEFVWVRK